MTNIRAAADVFDEHAAYYDTKFGDVSLYKLGLDLLCKELKNNARVLELACGPGNITKYLLNSRPDLQFIGTDLSVNMLEIAKKHNPKADFQIMDARDLHKIKDHYDAVVCAFGLPYLTKTEALKLIHDARKILNPGGLIYLSTMEDDNSKSGVELSSKGNAVFMNYHESSYLEKQLSDEGFSVILTDRISYTDDSNKPVVDFIAVGRLA